MNHSDQKKNIEAIYPLSPMQQGMLFHSLYSEGDYFEQFSCAIDGELNVEAFKRALAAVVARHSALRTAFVWKKVERMLQVVQREVELPFELLDWRGDGVDPDRRLAELTAADRRRGFNLSKAPLLRFFLIRLGESAYRFYWSMHHLLSDGWSTPIILKEVMVLYEAEVKGFTPPLPPARPFAHYIDWLQKQSMDKAQAFWRRRLAGYDSPVQLMEDRLTDVERQAAGYAKVKRELLPELTSRLNDFGRRHGVTLNTLVQSAWAFLHYRYTGEDDVVFGATVSGRPPELPDVEQMVGLFINTLPVRVRIDEKMSVADWLAVIQQEAFEAREFEYAPLVDIHGWSELPREAPLFSSIVVFENYPVDESLHALPGSLKFSDFRSAERTNYPLTLVAGVSDRLTLEIAFDGTRFFAGTVERFLQHLERILIAMIKPEQRLGSVQMLSDAEVEQLTVQWNESARPFDHELCLHQVFEKRVAEQPNAPALVFHDIRLSYGELNRRVNQWAHYVRRLGVAPETRVAVYLERSAEMIIALLAVLKAGGAYVPIDPTYPQERVQFILQDSGVSLILTQASLIEQISEFADKCLDVYAAADKVAALPSENPTNLTVPENLAYVIYTSGSTGRPKGTLLQHRGAVNMAATLGRTYHMKPEHCFLQFSSLGFDASVGEIFPALLGGAHLVVVDRETMLSPEKLIELMKREKVTTAILPPSVLSVLPESDLPQLKIIGSAGEACTPDLVKRWAPGRCYINGYGPTESSVGSTFMEICGGVSLPNVPIGRPFDNVRVYVLDRRLRPTPVGAPGELCVAGVGLARGYLNRPDLTAEKFIPDPFALEAGARMYRTGDLVRYLPDGNLEFLGRIDHQVKIRGFRIELGEIESLLKSHESVQDAAVAAREGAIGQKMLIGYYVPKGDVDPSAIKAFLQKSLPDYMVPALLIPLPSMPLNASGKIDRRALPAPDLEALSALRERVAPRNEIESLLAGIWQSLLKCESVGVTDSFFELGGHSLLATQMVSRVRETLGVELPLKDFFAAPTIAQAALLVEAARRESQLGETPPITPVPRDGELPLSFAQQRLWFLDQLTPGQALYNIPGAFRLTGDLDQQALEKSLREIVRRHESLRTTFGAKAGKPYQIIHNDIKLPLEHFDISALPAEEREAAIRQLAEKAARTAFDLAAGPLFLVHLVKVASAEHVLIFNMHHIISDGWSMGVLIKEFAQLYRAFLAGEPSPLPELTLGYADYAVWQRAQLQGERLARQLDFWQKALGQDPPVLHLPTDRPRPPVQTFKGDSVTAVLPLNLQQSVQEFCRRQGVTPFMFLLAVFQTLIYRYAGRPRFAVGSPIANRTAVETEALIGFFVNTLVLPADVSGNPEFLALLKRVRETTLDAYAHQDVPFEQLVEALQPERDMSHSPLFQVAFMLQNTPLNALQLPGLTLAPVAAESKTAKYDLTVTAAETADGLMCSFEFNSDLFERATVERMIGHFRRLIEASLSAPRTRVAELPLMTEEERRRLLIDWNDTATPYPDRHTVHGLFEEWAARQPNAPAVMYHDQIYSYGELDRRANRLARHLRRQGAGVEQIIGISMRRCADVAAAVLAILKTGAAFLNIDPTYPRERLAFMLKDSGISILITQHEIASALPEHDAQIVLIDDWATIAQEGDENLQTPLTPDNAAYVIYTSGSTGRPKGTVLPHRGLCNLHRAQRTAFAITPQHRVLQFAPLSFDASVWETVMALLNGACLVYADQEELTSGHGLRDVLKSQRIHIVTLPPSVLSVMPFDEMPDLKTIVTAGEACSQELVRRWGLGRQYVNAYGPTETTVCASYHEARVDDEKTPPIGRPLQNFQLYVLDAHGSPTPVGVPGELCIGGVGLARGYHRRPDLTAEKFVPDPFSGAAGARLYRTGDLCRYRADGNIEFLGRIDHQVKVRGFRIELGEIEAVLNAQPEVKDAVVLARQDGGEARLVAYVVCDEKLTAADLKGRLRLNLPDYMIPSAVVTLPEFPLTPSGKIDRKALPKPEMREQVTVEFVAPRTDTEKTLAAIVAELLNLPQVGVHDNFFELGGHSLLATQFMSRIAEAFQIELPLMIVFEQPTVAQLAERIEAQRLGGDRIEVIEKLERGNDDLSAMLAELEGLSDDEVRALLQSDGEGA